MVGAVEIARSGGKGFTIETGTGFGTHSDSVQYGGLK